MALCTQYSAIVVTNAGTSSINGIYYPTDVTTVLGNSFTKFVKQGNISFPSIEIGQDGGFYYWVLRGVVPFTGAILYRDYASVPSVTDPNLVTCPTQGQWYAAFGETPLPTITGISSQNTHGLSQGVVTLLTSRFGSVDNFLRLRNQGQI